MTAALPTLLLALATLPAAARPDEATVADRVVLHDGTAVLGQVLPSRPSRVVMAVRRSWAEAHAPGLAATRQDRDDRQRARARSDRLDRLRRWRHERPTRPGDPIADWLDREIARLERPIDEDRPPLMVVSWDRRDVAEVEQQPDDRRRRLRQGWRAGFDDVETMSLDRLRDGLQARGFALGAIDPAPIDDLLPIPVETDSRWLARRASTEVLADPDLRLIRFGGLVMPDAGPVADADEARLAGVAGDLMGQLLGASPARDPMAPHLDRIEASGRVGAVVTRLEMSPSFDRVAVEATLLVRTGPGRWEPAARRRAEVRPADLPAGAGRDLAADPQVQSAFTLLGALGIGRTDPEAERLSLAVGAAVQAALDRAGSALNADLRSAAIRLDRDAEGGPPGGSR